jgi:predicted AAA+ superfamily ATPase
VTVLSPDAAHVLRDLNPWWRSPATVRPEPPAFVRPLVASLSVRLRKPKGLIEVIRGPRQVGKTTGIHQIIRDLLGQGIPGTDILFVRFDLELLRDEPAALRNILRWYTLEVRGRSLDVGQPTFLFLGEVHKLRGWSEEVKHVGDTFPTNQPTVGRYLHYLSDALLVREFRRYPLAKKASARVPAKLSLTDLGVRNAILRGAPSLWESDPTVLGPLVETLVQGCIRDHNLQVHFFRDFEKPGDRRSRVHEVDFVAERIDGAVLPLEVRPWRLKQSKPSGLPRRVDLTRGAGPGQVSRGENG